MACCANDEVKGRTTTTLESKEWQIVAYASQGIPDSTHLKLRTRRISLDPNSIPERHVVFETLFLSVDPYLRSRMTGHEEGLYFPPFKLNQVIEAFGVGRVIRSKDEKYSEGDVAILPYCPVAEYCVLPSEALPPKLDPNLDIPFTDYLGPFGVPGFAAWVGIEVLGEAKAGDNVFISAAAGGVGIFAGQLAKLKGCRVVGSTGSDEKVKLVKEEFGYDEAFNYKKETDFNGALSRYFPNGIDLYVDNVGGKMLEAVLNHVNKHARITVCGMISDYNKEKKDREGVKNLLNIVGKEVKMQGYIIGSYLGRFGEFINQMTSYAKQGKIKSKSKVYPGIVHFLEGFESIFTGSSVGKIIIQVK